MRHIAAYALLLVGVNAAPTAEQVRFRNRIVDSLHELYAFELMSPHASFTLTFFSVLLSTVTQANMFTQIYFQNDIKQVSALVVAAGGESDEAQVAALFANLEGKDIHPYQIDWQNRWLKFGDNLAAKRESTPRQSNRWPAPLDLASLHGLTR